MEDKKLNITEADDDSQLKPLVSYYKIMSEGSQVKCIIYKIFGSLYISIPELFGMPSYPLNLGLKSTYIRENVISTDSKLEKEASLS